MLSAQKSAADVTVPGGSKNIPTRININNLMKASKNMNRIFEKIKGKVQQVYPKADTSSTLELAEELLEIVGDTTLELYDIIACVISFEEESGIEYDCSCSFEIFDYIIDLLENNKENANRLYDFVIHNCELYSVISKLIIDNSEHLTDRQTEKLIPIVEQYGFLFDREYNTWSWG